MLAALGLLAGAPARAGQHPIEPFLGEYHGRTINVEGEGLSERDLSVSIRQSTDGFTVDWTTVARHRSGTLTKKSYSVEFIPTHRAHIYSSAMKRNVFGGREALDPLRGEPFVWARIRGATLTVYALLITDEGGYEMQVYDRRLTERGIDLRFARFRDGTRLRLIEGVLERVD